MKNNQAVTVFQADLFEKSGNERLSLMMFSFSLFPFTGLIKRGRQYIERIRDIAIPQVETNAIWWYPGVPEKKKAQKTPRVVKALKINGLRTFFMLFCLFLDFLTDTKT